MKETKLTLVVQDDGVWADDYKSEPLIERWKSFLVEIFAIGEPESIFYSVVVESAEERDIPDEVEDGEYEIVNEDETLGG